MSDGYDIFGNFTEKPKLDPVPVNVNIYADEIQSVFHSLNDEEWIYTGAIYEIRQSPILPDLIHERYCQDKPNWEQYREKNDTDIHWADLRDDLNKKFVVKRWLDYILKDCFEDRNFRFSLFGINLSNLNQSEFGEQQLFNTIYNRFFRLMLLHSLKTLFNNKTVVVDNIYHERGPQADHEYFDWHTIYRLDQDENLNFSTRNIQFLPKSHRDDRRSNVLELCDVLLGIFKDVHLGIKHDTYPSTKKEILDSEFTQELLIKRLVKNPGNPNSKYRYSDRFNISLFPNKQSEPDTLRRLTNNFYDIRKVFLEYERNPDHPLLF